MTDGTAGWFKDPSDSTLARWHDGNDWTEHTLVIADQTPGVEPSPPVIESPDPARAPRHTATPVPAAAGGRLRRLPVWAKIGAPLAAILLVVVAVSLVSSSDDAGDRAETSDTVATGLEDAVDAARLSGLPDSISDSRAGDLMQRICEAAERPGMVAPLGRVLGELPVSSPGELRNAIDALGDGARTLCAEALRASPDLIEDLQRLAVAAFSTTTSTSPTLVPEGTDAGVPGADGGLDGVDGGDDRRSSGDSRTTTTRRRGATGTTGGSAPRPTSPPATPAPTTTTTLRGVLRGQSCSPAGATARNQITGGNITCGRTCGGSLQWGANCAAPTTPPPPAATTTTATPPPPPPSSQ
ncbi:MAG: DUF2510 domain-containing protein [Acidimicrobiales bacterium]|nr:DUF2510 domain-containing protein [Acidimicrobiales bacterium]